jgi:hypothetical protein
MRAAGALAAAAALWLGGCAAGPEAPSGPVDWDEQLDLGEPGPVIQIVEDVEFYPACGNETLMHAGTTWYPFTRADGTDAPDPSALGREGSGDRASAAWARASAVRAVPAVVAPGPGDDVGTLVEYEGGFAHWVSDSGELRTWLTTTEITYAWVC